MRAVQCLNCLKLIPARLRYCPYCGHAEGELSGRPAWGCLLPLLAAPLLLTALVLALVLAGA